MMDEVFKVCRLGANQAQWGEGCGAHAQVIMNEWNANYRARC